MTTYILILAFWSGALSNHDSMAMVSTEFSSQESCQQAGETSVKQFQTMMKTVKFICSKK